MSFSRASISLPRHTVMLLSPWLVVGSALILGLAISFWAVRNVRLERENMVRNLLERAGALMWAMEGGARAGMGMHSASSYLQFMLEETARQPGIAYMAVITRQGKVVAHSDRRRIGDVLYPAEAMASFFPVTHINWRIVSKQNTNRLFEAFKIFAPSPNFEQHMEQRTGTWERMMRGMGRGAMLRGMPPPASENSTGTEPNKRQPGAFREEPGGEQEAELEKRSFRQSPQGQNLGEAGGDPLQLMGRDLLIVIGLDMAPFENALTAGERSIAFTAFLVGLLGVGGFISLFWAQSYKISRRLLLDAGAVTDKMISSLPVGLIILDASGRITEVNSLAGNILGCPQQKLLGLTPEELWGADWAGIARRVQAGESVLEEEHTLDLPEADKTAQGEHCAEQEEARPMPLSISAARILNDEGESLGMFYLLRDLREVKRLQAELRRNERLSTLGNMAARVAHEVRNPLSSIKGFATYLASRHENDADKEAARTMIREVDRLNRVVSELLDFARPSGLTIAPADMGAIVRRATRLVEMDAKAKGVELILALPPEDSSTPVRVAVDAERITQALLNLLLNAVQATSSGGSVSVALSDAPSASGDRVLVTIADTGRGMPPETLAQIFTPYFTTKASGTGLGLSIVAKIVEDHHGEITIHSVEGQGATALLWLPAIKARIAGTPGDSHA